MNNRKNGQGTHCTKMGADSLAKNTPNAPEFICPICLPMCVSSGFPWKKALSDVGSPWYVAIGRKWKCSNASFFKVSLALCWGSLIPDFTKNLDNRQKCHNMDKFFMKPQAIMFSSSIYFVLCYTHFGLYVQNFELYFRLVLPWSQNEKNCF